MKNKNTVSRQQFCLTQECGSEYKIDQEGAGGVEGGGREGEYSNTGAHPVQGCGGGGGKHLQDNTNCDCKQKFLYLHPSLSLSPPFSLPASEGDRERPENMADPETSCCSSTFLRS